MLRTFHFDAALKDYLDPPELEAADEHNELPDHGTCPFCREDLTWDGIDDIKSECLTIGCKYDNSKTEDQNRAEFVRMQA